MIPYCSRIVLVPVFILVFYVIYVRTRHRSREKACKSTTFFWHDQIILQENAFFFAFFTNFRVLEALIAHRTCTKWGIVHTKQGSAQKAKKCICSTSPSISEGTRLRGVPKYFAPLPSKFFAVPSLSPFPLSSISGRCYRPPSLLPFLPL